MNTLWTPPPWKVVSTYAQAQKGHGYIATWAEQECPLAVVKPLHIDPAESWGNLQVMSLAPVMAAALQALVAAYESLAMTDPQAQVIGTFGGSLAIDQARGILLQLPGGAQ